MANDNIFQQYLTPPKSVMDYAAQYDEADARKQTLQTNALSLAAGQQKMADSARDREADNVLSRLYASGQTPDQIAVGLAQQGYGKQAMAFTKQQQDLATAKATGTHLTAQTGKLTAETDDIGTKAREAKRQKAISDIAAFTSPQQALDSLALHEQAGDIAPEQAALIRQTIPQHPADFPRWQVGMLQRIATPDKAMGQIAPDANTVATNARIKSEGDANRGVQMRGQNLVDARAKEANAGTDVAYTTDAIDNAAARYNMDGTLPPMGMGANGSTARAAILNRAAVLAKASGVAPEDQRAAQLANKGDAAARAAAVKGFSTGKEGTALRSFNVATDHLNTLGQMADALNNGDTQLFNRASNYIKEQTGNPAPTNFDAVKEIVGKEVVKAIVAGGGGVSEREELSNLLGRAKSPAQLKGVISHFTGLMDAQRAGLIDQYQRTTGRTDGATVFAPSKPHGAAPPATPPGFDAAAIAAELKKRGH